MLGSAQMSGGAEPAKKPPIEDPNGDDPRQPASEEEQAAYQAYVEAGIEVIMTEDGQPEDWVLGLLRGEYDENAQKRFAKADPPLRPLDKAPVDALAVATISVLLEIEDIAGQGGAELADEIVYNGGAEIMSVMAEASEAAGIHDYSEDDLEVAFYRAVDLYRITSSRIDPENLKKEFGAFVAAEQGGGETTPPGQAQGDAQAAAATGGV